MKLSRTGGDVTKNPDEPVSVTNNYASPYDLPGFVTHSQEFDQETINSLRNAHYRDRTVTVTPDNNLYQPENGDIMVEGKLLKGIWEPGTGTDLTARSYRSYMQLGKYRKPERK